MHQSSRPAPRPRPSWPPGAGARAATARRGRKARNRPPMGSPASVPAFGEADLSNCEREQIHFAGSIQPYGALLVLREPELTVVQASANAQAFWGLSSGVVGRRLGELSSQLEQVVRGRLTRPLGALPAVLRCPAGPGGAELEGLVHRLPGAGLVVEVQTAERAGATSSAVAGALAALGRATTLRALCDESARMFRSLTGYDRVMIYRFDDDGHGEVLSEEREPKLEPFLGNRYPATDIPQMARRLYERNRVRVLMDVQHAQVPITPRISPLDGGELDMSLCFLRSSSPIHIQYLRNMGVRATLVVSLMVGGRLWGLVSCHHYEPRGIPFAMRSVCELLSEFVATRLTALECVQESQAQLAVRRLEQRMAEAIAREGDWRSSLFDGSGSILKPVTATGAALVLDDEILTTGQVPGTEQLREIAGWLQRRGLAPSGHAAVFSTHALAVAEPAWAPLAAVASGLLAVRISNEPGEFLLWFRPEQVRTVTWGGDPSKPFVIGSSPADLSPRRSFAQWHQVVEGTSQPWARGALTTARLIGATVSDVVMQFRSVRMLIAQQQLTQVRGQAQRSEQAVMVAGPDGRVLLMSAGFADLLEPGRRAPERLDELAPFFTRPVVLLRKLQELVQQHAAYRGEAELLQGDGGARPVLLRADPVFSGPRQVLGFVLSISDAREQVAADRARRRFQEQVVEEYRPVTGRPETKADLDRRVLLASIIENAQLTAFEITDTADTQLIVDLLRSVQGSVDRSAELLADFAVLDVQR
ncbi:MAG: GAF domain-containing protein [Myxococcaceae bacterium]|nr:GAF domain-containing protein [Myxococcaceae bacterium]